ncbi:lipase member H-A isoform X2 [Drosophila busckii]|uniref:lipase member H-A isoform X2 n=1 Tax=Drosophila busckii TaxID=30019 RepID=UPI00083EA70E|nr:lipase member H-A isoform X2 [Drosophila busckii]
MAKTFYCWLPFFCQLWGIQTLSLQSLANQSRIYIYEQTAQEQSLEQVQQLQAEVQSLKLIVHGFLGSRTHSSIMPLRNAYEAQGYEHILVADWSPAANLDYASSRRAIWKVSQVLAKQLQQFLGKHNVPLHAVHVIGHSLGAHIAGCIGRYFNGSLARVTGLDPALPLFTPRADDSLQSTAAQLVDVIHTDYPFFGDHTPRGTVDFYPNFGRTPQPGCEEVDLLSANSCSHNRAVLFYAESIGLPKNFPAIPCRWQQLRAGNNCWAHLQEANLNSSRLQQAISSMDVSQVVYMGEQLTRSATSYYYLQTNAAPPFGQGVHAKFS